MSYSTVTIVAKSTGHKDGIIDAGGLIAQAVDTAFLMIKGRIKRAGLTPPSSDDTLKAAETNLAIAYIIRRERMDGSLPRAEGGSFDSQDSVNKAIKYHTDIAWELVNDYLATAQTNVQPNDVNGQSRSDYVFKDFKLNQRDIGGFVDIDGESLADDQRS